MIEGPLLPHVFALHLLQSLRMLVGMQLYLICVLVEFPPHLLLGVFLQHVELHYWSAAGVHIQLIEGLWQELGHKITAEVTSSYATNEWCRLLCLEFSFFCVFQIKTEGMQVNHSPLLRQYRDFVGASQIKPCFLVLSSRVIIVVGSIWDTW